MRRSGEIAIGLDLGTSSLKAVAVDADSGRIVARARRPYATLRPEPGAAEQSPSDWMAAALAALGELAAETRADSWIGIGLSAMLPTLVCLDASGEPVGPAIVWEDNRAEPEADDLLAAHPGALAYERTGQLLDGRYLVPMWERLRRRDAALADRVSHIVGAKDYLFARLTGVLLTDPSTAAGAGNYGLASEEYAPGNGPEQPGIAPPETILGLDPGVARLVGARPGLPVSLGAADSVLGAAALGARPGRDVAIISGTSTVVLGLREDLVFDPLGRALVTPLAGPGYGLEMDLVATGSAFQWLAGLTGAGSPERLAAEAAEIDPAAAPGVLPFVGPGEQGALWAPELHGAFSGLTLGTTRGELMRGLMTGIVLELRRCVGVLTDGAAADGRILVAGSSLDATVMLQDLADATGREVFADRSGADHSALGAIAVLLAGLGRTPHATADGFERFVPRPEREETWERLAAEHDRAIARERDRIAE